MYHIFPAMDAFEIVEGTELLPIGNTSNIQKMKKENNTRAGKVSIIIPMTCERTDQAATRVWGED
jgi:hypothetical protein